MTVPCAGCLLSRRECVCPYFHELRIVAIPYEPKINHNRPNPFLSTQS